MRKIIFDAKRALAPKRAVARGVAIVLALTVLSVVAGGCTGANSEYWRERPASSNYTRLPVR